METAKAKFLQRKRARGDYSNPFLEADHREVAKKLQAESRARLLHPSMVELLDRQAPPQVGQLSAARGTSSFGGIGSAPPAQLGYGSISKLYISVW